MSSKRGDARRQTQFGYIRRLIFCGLGCVGLVPNIYYVLFPFASLLQGTFVPSVLNFSRLGLLLGGSIVSFLLLFGAARGIYIGPLLVLAALLIAEYIVIRSGLLA